MSTAPATATSARAPRCAVAVTDRTVLIGLGLFVVLLAALTWQTWGDLGSDTGYDLIASQRLADGEIPYRDFPYFYGPLAPALGALVVLIGGSGLAPFIAFGMLLSAAIVGAVYALARVVAGPLSSGLAAAITATVAFAPTNFSFVLPHSQSATIGLLAGVLFLLGASRFAAGGSRGWLWCAGRLGRRRHAGPPRVRDRRLDRGRAVGGPAPAVPHLQPPGPGGAGRPRGRASRSWSTAP